MKNLRMIPITAGLIAACLLAACAGEAAPAPVGPDAEEGAGDNPPAAPAEPDDLGPLPTLHPDSGLDPDDALVQDARYFARDANITVEEAYRRLRLQGPIGELNARLTENEAATFAGLWIQHEPEYGVVVRFTEDGEETLRPYVEGTELAALVEVRGADYTLDELSAIQTEAHDLANALGFQVSSGQNVRENRVELFVPDRAAFEAALAEGGETLPQGVAIVEADAVETLE